VYIYIVCVCVSVCTDRVRIHDTLRQSVLRPNCIRAPSFRPFRQLLCRCVKKSVTTITISVTHRHPPSPPSILSPPSPPSPSYPSPTASGTTHQHQHCARSRSDFIVPFFCVIIVFKLPLGWPARILCPSNLKFNVIVGRHPA